MRDIIADLKALRLHGMVSTWPEMLESEGHGSLSLQTTRPVLARLLEAKHTDRGMRSIAHQMAQARFPAHRDLTGFDFASARVDRLLVEPWPRSNLPTRRTTWCSSVARAPASPSGHRAGHPWHHLSWQACALHLDGGSGQRTGG